MSSPTLVRVHRFVALGLGALAVLVALAGGALVFRAELTPLATPEIVVPAREKAPDAYQRMLDAARSLEPSARAFDLAPPARADRAIELIVRGPAGDRHLYFDPYDARLVADSERQAMPFVTLYRLHKELLGGGRGAYAVGIVGLALAFLVLSGLVLWWPRAWKHAFRLRLGGNRIAVSFDLHRLAGVTFGLFLLANALIGAAMAFDEATAQAVNTLAGWRDPLPAPAPVGTGPAKPLDTLVSSAQAAMPEGRVSRVQVRDGAATAVRKVRPGEHETNGMNRILVDPASGAVVQVRARGQLEPGRAMYEWLYPLHTGTLLGLPHRIALLIAGLAPLVSLVTGFILWRSKAKRSPSKRASPAPAAALRIPAERQPQRR